MNEYDPDFTFAVGSEGPDPKLKFETIMRAVDTLRALLRETKGQRGDLRIAGPFGAVEVKMSDTRTKVTTDVESEEEDEEEDEE